MRTEQKNGRQYDLQLYLGQWAFGRVPGVPSVSWVQGPPGTDGRSIARHAAQLIELDGLPRYSALRAFAMYRNTLGQPSFGNTDVFICGSQWAVDQLKLLVPAGAAVKALAYPVDLQRFYPSSGETGLVREQEVLWLGRSVPRKRLDLFLSACELLIESGRPITVRVIGGFGFAPGYRKLLNEFRYPDRLSAADGVPRSEVPALLSNATVLVQPSEDENFGSSVAEALACGTPVVLGPTNGTGDYIADAGAKFDFYTPKSVAAAIGPLLDAVACDPIGWLKRCRAAAEMAFDSRQVVAELEKILLDSRTRLMRGLVNKNHIS